MGEKLYLYPVWVRIWHFINALLCLLLIFSGVSLQYSNPDLPIIRFDIAVSMHNICGVILSINYLIFLIGNLTTKNGIYYRNWYSDLKKNLMKQFRFYTSGIFKKEKGPYPINEKRKFNPLQKISYVAAMYFFIPILIISGWVLLFPELIPNFSGLSGLYVTDLFHIISGFVISVFLFVHVYFCTIGTTTTSNFRSIISGWHK